MADEQQSQTTETDAKENDKAAASAETKNTDTEPQELMIPKHRYDEVSKKLKALEDAAAKAADDQRKADEKRMEEQQQWRELAETRGKELTEAKGKAADFDKLSELVAKQLKAEVDAWPEKVKGLFPTDEMPVLEMLEWAERFRPLAQEMAGDKTTVAPAGNHRRPAPVAPAGQHQNEQRTRESHQRWSRGRF